MSTSHSPTWQRSSLVAPSIASSPSCQTIAQTGCDYIHRFRTTNGAADLDLRQSNHPVTTGNHRVDAVSQTNLTGNRLESVWIDIPIRPPYRDASLTFKKAKRAGERTGGRSHKTQHTFGFPLPVQPAVRRPSGKGTQYVPRLNGLRVRLQRSVVQPLNGSDQQSRCDISNPIVDVLDIAAVVYRHVGFQHNRPGIELLGH